MSSYEDFIYLYWIVLVISFFLCAGYFFYQKHKAAEDEDRQRIMMIVLFIYLFLGISRLIHLIANLRHGSFVGDYSLENDLIFSFSEIFFYFAIFIIVFAFERRIKQSERKLYTIIIIVVTIPFLIMNYVAMFNMDNPVIVFITNTISVIMNIVLVAIVLILSFMYLKISFKTSGEVRRKALFIFLGYFILILGNIINVLEEFGLGKDTIAIIAFTFSLSSIPFLILGYKK